jgi:hypothetical protein
MPLEQSLTAVTKPVSQGAVLRLVDDGGFEDRPAIVLADATPMAARRENQRRVVEVLEAESVDYFLVRGREVATSVIAVAVADRTRVLVALEEAMTTAVASIQVIQPHGTGRNRRLPADDPQSWKSVQNVTVLRCMWLQCDAGGTLVLGAQFGCDIEFWSTRADGQMTAPRPNLCTRLVDPTRSDVVGPDDLSRLSPFTFDEPRGSSFRHLRTLTEFTVPLPEDIRFPIDVVYTWVDGTDPTWAAKRAALSGVAYHAEASSAARYLSRDELRYSLRSLHMFAPWVRNIFIVTDQQRPQWLSDHPRVQLVDHTDVFSDSSWLPTYNSHAIETQLHHIAGLSEHFLYLNDDMFFGRAVTPNAFFHSNGIAKHFPSMSRIPQGPVGPEDTPVDAACKNNRRLLQRDFGPVIVQSMQHVPYALRRSVLLEMEQRYHDAYGITAASRFRSLTDHSFTSSFHQYYAYLTGRGVGGSVRYGYIQLAVRDLAQRLDRLLFRRDWDTFCLNDAFSSEEELEAQVQVLTTFLNAYFPVVAPWEVNEPR